MTDSNGSPAVGEDSQPSLEFTRLLGLAQQGNNEAIAKLVDDYRDYLLFIANQGMEPALKTKLGASDVVQQSLVAICQQLPEFRGRSEPEFRGWIRRIVNNHVLNSRRSFQETKQRAIRQEVRLDDSRQLAPGILDSQKTPQASALIRELAAELELCLSQLSESHQRVLRMRNWQELSFNQIGEALGCTPDAARKLWFRAFKCLQNAVLRTRPEFASHLSAISRNSDETQTGT
jgi:RNA polymerase sigma-70 factor (ECF subfamily)